MRNQVKETCRECGKRKTIYSQGFCQKCYRSFCDKYSYYKVINMPDKWMANKQTFDIIDMAVKHNLPAPRIAKRLNIKPRAVRYVLNKYCIQCDSAGNPKPVLYDRNKNKHFIKKEIH